MSFIETLIQSISIFFLKKYFFKFILIYFKQIKKQSNTLLFFNKQKNQLSIKIGDLGSSKVIEDYLNSFAGTPFFLSPELGANQAYTAKTDVWLVFFKRNTNAFKMFFHLCKPLFIVFIFFF
jgi:serine/threonine protein kinase